ncbi:MAG: hypothetical protein KKG02_03905 [Candidatus Edwardsbacteria bacterium]|nr:hypothetical protein [Candidatus Edwardsbacteria bacterium]
MKQSTFLNREDAKNAKACILLPAMRVIARKASKDNDEAIPGPFDLTPALSK